MNRNKTTVLALFLIILLKAAINAQGDRINLNSTPGMAKGTIFFMAETDVSFQNTAINTPTIRGTQFFTTWGTIEKTEGVYDWSKIDATIEAFRASGKKLALCIPTTSFSINDTPEYLYTNYGLRRIVAGYWESFESTADKGYVFYGTKSTSNPIVGTKSLQMTTSVTKVLFETGSNHIFNTSKGITNPTFNPNVVLYPNRPSAGFCMQFDYRANTATSFTARAYSKSNAALQQYETTWTASTGESGMKTFNFYPLTNDYKVEVRINNDGNLTVDNINICDMVTGYHIGTLCFPNYFNPIFKQKYEVFVKALTDRYRNEEVINSINVGGYGRWEEITISADEANMFEDQWTTFGYTNDKYIAHITSCIDIYKKHFPEKRLYTGAVGWNMESWRDQNYIDWKVQNYAAKNGVSIKYNGWQAMCSEWGSPNTGFHYNAHRFKYNPSMWVMYEEAGQINNEHSEYQGHPISMLNKAIIDGVDYNWMYSVDLSQPYINKYFHYANESAGATLTTKMYNLFGRTDYYSPHAQKNFVHKNIWQGLYQRDDFPGTKFDYVNFDGQKAVRTSPSQRKIQISVDDRFRYHEMYGAVFSLDYLDTGTDALKVNVNTKFGMMQVALIRKTNTTTWKTITFTDSGWLTKSKNSGADDLIEIEIDDMGDGVEILKSLEVNYVPANDFQEKLVAQKEATAGNRALVSSTYNFTYNPIIGNNLSSIALNISPASATGTVNVEAVITATVYGENKAVTTKEYYMPSENDWFNLPVANVPQATQYQISLKAKMGQFYLHLGADNQPAVRYYSYFIENSQESDVDAAIDEIEALRPFLSLNIKNAATGQLTLLRKKTDGSYLEIEKMNAITNTVYFTPQPAGQYKLIDAALKTVQAIPVYLKKLPTSNKPMRNIFGTNVKDFLADSALFVVSGLKQCSNDQQGFHARLTSENPILISSKALNLSFSNLHNIHFVMKNETSSSLAKIYWKTDISDYSEANSLLMPIVPNDDCYREYMYPIGLEPTWRSKIMEIKFLPVIGHTDAGKIHIHAFDIRKGTTNPSLFLDTLAINTTNFSITSGNISSLKQLPTTENQQHLRVYPNPAKEMVTVEVNNQNDEPMEVSLVSLTGMIYRNSKEKGKFTLDLNNIPSGAMFITVRTNNNLYKKLILKN
jgi:hypothetical protein